MWKEEDMWAKQANKRRPEAQMGASHAATVLGRVGPPRLALEPPFARFLCPQVFFLPNIDARKFPGDFVDVWVPETLK